MLHNRVYLGEIVHKDASFPGQQPAIIDQKLWDKVQAQFQSNLQAPRKRPRITEQSLLMGLLYDENGNRFTPTHANKKGLRYRYYVSQAVINNTKNEHSGSVRIPADEIEEMVTSQFTLLLQSPQGLIDVLVGANASPAEIHAVTEASREWSTAPSDKIQDLLRSTVKKGCRPITPRSFRNRPSTPRHNFFGGHPDRIHFERPDIICIRQCRSLC